MTTEVLMQEIDAWYSKAILATIDDYESSRDALMKTIARGARIESLQKKVGELSYMDGYQAGLRDASVAFEKLVVRHA